MLKMLIYGYILLLKLLMLNVLYLDFSLKVNQDMCFLSLHTRIHHWSVLSLINCKSSGAINWSSLVFLSLTYQKLTDDMLEKVLSCCPNLELGYVLGFHRLEISSVKLTSLSINYYENENIDLRLKIVAPHINHVELLGCCDEIRLQQEMWLHLSLQTFFHILMILHMKDETRRSVDISKNFFIVFPMSRILDWVTGASRLIHTLHCKKFSFFFSVLQHFICYWVHEFSNCNSAIT